MRCGIGVTTSCLTILAARDTPTLNESYSVFVRLTHDRRFVGTVVFLFVPILVFFVVVRIC
jgi:hypothetical protein